MLNLTPHEAMLIVGIIVVAFCIGWYFGNLTGFTQGETKGTNIGYHKGLCEKYPNNTEARKIINCLVRDKPDVFMAQLHAQNILNNITT